MKNDINATSFRLWLETNYKNFIENYRIAPLSGPNAPNVVINYSRILDDIKKIKELPNDFLKTFSSLRAKGNYRPHNTKNPIKFFQDNNCEDYIPIINELSENVRSHYQ